MHALRLFYTLLVRFLFFDVRVHLCFQCRKLFDWTTATLVFHFSEDFVVFVAEKRVVLCVFASVKHSRMLFYILIEVLGLDLDNQTIRIRIQQLTAVTVKLLELVVKSIVHHGLAEFKDCHMTFLFFILTPASFLPKSTFD